MKLQVDFFRGVFFELKLIIKLCVPEIVKSRIFIKLAEILICCQVIMANTKIKKFLFKIRINLQLNRI